MALAVVWYSAWQMECCGDDFAVGDTVSWHLDDAPDPDWYEAALGPEIAQRITHAEEHHPTDDDFPAFTGRVLGLQRAWCRYSPTGSDNRVLYPAPNSALFERVDASDIPDRREHGELTFNGWIVELELADFGASG